MQVSVQDSTESQTEHPVNLGMAATTILEVKVPKKDGRTTAGKKKRKKADMDDGEEDEQHEDQEVGEHAYQALHLTRHGLANVTS